MGFWMIIEEFERLWPFWRKGDVYQSCSKKSYALFFEAEGWRWAVTLTDATWHGLQASLVVIDPLPIRAADRLKLAAFVEEVSLPDSETEEGKNGDCLFLSLHEVRQALMQNGADWETVARQSLIDFHQIARGETFFPCSRVRAKVTDYFFGDADPQKILGIWKHFNCSFN